MKYLFTIVLIFAMLMANANDAGKKVAVVKMLRGSVVVVNQLGKEAKLKKGDWLIEGSTVKTAIKSFAKLSFIDKSTMNVGPKSEMKIEKFSKEAAGVINVISGKIRSKVTKDYLNMDKDKSKLFVKSRSAVMGVRGTDFVFSTNAKTGNSTAVLFEGKIVMNKIKPGENLRNLEGIVNQGRSLVPGQFSVVNNKLAKPTVPARLNSRQLKNLEKNDSFVGKSTEVAQKKLKSIVPPGLSGEVVGSTGNGLDRKVGSVANVESVQKKVATLESRGFINGEDAKPADGAIVHLDSGGAIMPIGNDSVYNGNTGEWESKSIGTVDKNGNYLPPEGYTITETGTLLKEVNGENKIVIAPDVPTINDTPSLGKLPIKDIPNDGRAPGGFIEPQPAPEEQTLLPPCPPGQICIKPDGGTGGIIEQQPRIIPKTKVKIFVQ